MLQVKRHVDTTHTTNIDQIRTFKDRYQQYRKEAYLPFMYGPATFPPILARQLFFMTKPEWYHAWSIDIAYGFLDAYERATMHLKPHEVAHMENLKKEIETKLSRTDFKEEDKEA